MSWSPVGYVILSLAAELRECAGCLVDQGYTESQLTTLGDAFPSLTSASRGKYSLDDLTRLLRGLVSEGISIQRSAGDSWRCAGLQLHSCGYAFVLDDRLPIPSDSVLTAKDLIAFVRTQMKRSISHAHTSGGETLGVYVLESHVEEMLRRQR